MDTSGTQAPGAVKCIDCGSTDVMFSKKRGVYICEDCACEFTPGEKKQPKRIFISHMEMEPVAGHLRNDLASAGYDLWPDPYTSDDREAHRAHGLEWVAESGSNGRLIVLMTPESVRRPDGYCLSDITQAVQTKVPIIPIMLSRCDMPLSICRIQRIDMMDCLPIEQHKELYEDKLRLIIETIDEELLDYKNVQSRLLHVLEPLPFDVDIQRHLARFTGRQWIFKRVDKWLADPDASRVFWIIGPPGVGKTAISSWLAFNRPEVAAFHLCSYGDSQKSDPRRAIASIAYQLSTQLPEYQDRLNSLNLERIIRESNAKTLFDTLIVQPLSGNFPRPEGVIAILIDALDEATQGGKNQLSELIASEFGRAPKWLRLIITSRPELEVMHPLQELTPYMLDTADPENEQDIREYLSRELKPFTDEKEVPVQAIDTITSMSEGIFLYVEWIRQELALKRLSLGRLDQFPRGLAGVYGQFFSRQYPEITKYRGRISPALETMVSALEPLNLSMIASIFRWDEYEQSDFCQELGALFPITEGKVHPFHKSITDWLTDPEKALGYYIDPGRGHLRLSDYGWDEYKMGVKAMSEYMLAHLPAHLISTMRWDKAVTVLTDLAYFDTAWNRNEFMVQNYWSQIESKGEIDMVISYRSIIDDPVKYDGHSAGVANLLYSAGHYVESEALFNHLIRYFTEKNDLRSLKNAYEMKGNILNYRGELLQAMGMFKEEERVCLELGDRFGLQDCLMNQTGPLLYIGDMDGINAIVQRMEKNSWSMNKRQISRILHSKALFLAETGKLDEALKLYREKERICNEIKDADCLYMTFNNEALILYEKGDFNESLAVNGKFEKLCLDHGNKLALSLCRLNFAFVYYDIGKTVEAIDQLKKARELAEKLGHKLTVCQCLGNLAIIYQDIGKMDEAMRLHEEEMAISNEQKDKIGLAYALGNIALIYHDRGILDEALRMLLEKQSLAQGSSIVRSVQAAIGNQALIHFDRGEFDKALGLHKEEETMCAQLGNIKEHAICILNQANIHYTMGQVDEAKRLYEESEQVFRKMGYLTGIQACLNGEALISYDRGMPQEALNRLKEAADICRRISHKKGLSSALANIAAIRYRQGNVEKSLQLLVESEKICREIDYREGLAISIMGQAVIAAFKENRRESALQMAQNGHDIINTCGIRVLAKKMRDIQSSIEMDDQAIIADGIRQESPGPIMWVVKKQKLDKNS